jgi:hypothetical protein
MEHRVLVPAQLSIMACAGSRRPWLQHALHANESAPELHPLSVNIAAVAGGPMGAQDAQFLWPSVGHRQRLLHPVAEILQPRVGCRQRLVDPVAAGRDTEVAFRVGGRKVTRDEFKAAQEAQQPKRQPKYLEGDVTWKGGLAQRRAAEQAQAAMHSEVLARPCMPCMLSIVARAFTNWQLIQQARLQS